MVCCMKESGHFYGGSGGIREEFLFYDIYVDEAMEDVAWVGGVIG